MRIYNKQKKGFDFNKLYELYGTNLDEARIMLYENLPVFISKYRINADEHNEYWDIYNSLFLCIDEALCKTCNPEYEAKQVYVYIHTRIRGRVYNLFTNSGKYHRFYEGESLDEMLALESSGDEDYSIDTTTTHMGLEGDHIKIDNELIHRCLLSIEEPYLSILIDKFFTDKKLSITTIAKRNGVNNETMKVMYMNALDIFKGRYVECCRCQ